ncbi:MAG TPA: hypothetical protein PK915_05120 [Bacteroidales bacterium]|nr:hypothetical protein [Bacteroidales bacterium]HRW96774.1 hypothetical protein [Bacteroidales bacterium]
MKICFDFSKKNLFSWLFLFIPALFILTTCSLDEETFPSQEAPYEGIWKGNTSQMTYLELEVRKINGRQVLYNLQFNYWNDTVLKQRKLTANEGFFRIEKDEFMIDLPDNGKISGYFAETNALEGELLIPGNNNNFQKLCYSASHADSAVTINSVCLTKFSLPDTTCVYQQVIRNFFTHTLIQNSDTGIVIGTSVNIENGMYAGQPVFGWNTGIFESVSEIKNYFTRGDKLYADTLGEGVEVLFYNPFQYWELWKSTGWKAEQNGSYFRITDIKSFPIDNPGIERLKVMAEFGCKVYGVRGDTLEISDGFFLGFVDILSAHIKKPD